MAHRIRMTPAWLARLDPNDPADQGEWPDEDTKGLRLRVRPGGMFWSVRYLANDRHARFNIGEYPAVGLAKARKKAEEVRGNRADDPQAGKRAEREAARRRRLGETVKGAIGSWLKDTKRGPSARWKGGLDGGTARSFMPHVNRLVDTVGDRKVAEIETKDIEKFISEPEAPATRNRALSVVRGFLAWAKRRHLIQTDPAAELKKERETERTRVMSDEEIRALVKGFDATRHGRVVRFLFLTGLRRDEALGLKWGWLDLEAGVLTLPPEAEKTGRSRGELRRVALSPQAVGLLAEQRAQLFAEGIRSEYVFAMKSGDRPHPDALKPYLYQLKGRRSNGLPASKHKLGKVRPVLVAEDVTVHDIRRTVADALLNRLHVAPWVVDHVVLGHARPKLLRTYMPNLPLSEAREALARWGDELARILGERTRADTGTT